MSNCPCGRENTYENCCQPIISGQTMAVTAEDMMRARYSAYVMQEIDFLCESLVPGSRGDWDAKSTKQWAEQSEWMGLEIVSTDKGQPEDNDGTVEFKAKYMVQNMPQEHHEIATFKKVDGKWYFVTGKSGNQPAKSTKVGRNDPCPCGSNKKYKKCCFLN
jgi:SEC-C motif-containing protein